MSVDMLQSIANTLGMPASYFLGEPDNTVTGKMQQLFIDRLLKVLENSDQVEIEELYGSGIPYEDIIEQKAPLTIATAKNIASELGVTLDYLTGRTEDPNAFLWGLHDSVLEDEVDDADAELILAVHEICGMDKQAIAEVYAVGKLRQVWDPRKIDMVREYLEDSKAILQKLLIAEFGEIKDSVRMEANDGEHSED